MSKEYFDHESIVTLNVHCPHCKNETPVSFDVKRSDLNKVVTSRISQRFFCIYCQKELVSKIQIVHISTRT